MVQTTLTKKNTPNPEALETAAKKQQEQHILTKGQRD
jgi:hypothetical protein